MRIVLAAALAAACLGPAAAQTPPAAADVALVRELLAASGAERHYEQFAAMMLASVRAAFHGGLAELLEEVETDPARRTRARALAERHVEELAREFRAQLASVMPYERLVEEVYAPVYLRHFTRAELSEAIGFYRSATGRKLAATERERSQDTAQLISVRYAPQLNHYVRAQVAERVARLRAELGTP
ncbi:MAG: DUF2059 domain-containing protein [Pseudomonadota bacterium]|jgi:hypothetical protein